MNIQEAIEKSRELLIQKMGVDCYPEYATLNRHAGKPHTWVIIYSPYCLNEELDAVIDGGEIIVVIDCQSGETSFKSETG
ncbi:hypothetical protein Mal35_15750 [Gimesia maris]|uniref:hypothetical protein n=1 Tax=Gimesia maris TaxID=122 RepID=UPI001189F964|nr:hypothetical protein [Gimesia maris]QDT78144.1 hypothetical protein Mal35_15750 [Gimesia maris]